MINARELLAYLSYKYEGDYDLMLDAIKRHEKIDEDALNILLSTKTTPYFTIIDDCYPEEFKQIYRPPLVVFYHGDIDLIKTVKTGIAVIGSRTPSNYGREYTRKLVDDFVKADLTIVSGFARGIDTIAHETVLKSGGKTIAVLGSGINYPYPKSNSELYEQLKESQLIISEYPDNVAPKPLNFPFRNRIVAALCKAIVVTEAHERSGTLITVGYGLTLGREIFCLPFEAGHRSSCNQLIKDGANLIESANDVIEIIRPVA